jgi:hypothetical protein
MPASNSLNIDTSGIQTYNTTTGDLAGSTTTQFNVLVGDTSNKLLNVAPSATSGIPLISIGAASNPSFSTAVVAGGGTGNTTFTAFSVICAGTTATGTFQNVSGVGTANQVLTSNGAGALPTWQSNSGSSGYALQIQASEGNPADATTYFMVYSTSSGFTSSTASGGALQQLFVTRTGTVTACAGNFGIRGTLGSAENTSVIIRKNNTTDATVKSTVQLTAAAVNFSNTAMSLAVTAGDYLEIKVVCPTWVTNPTAVSFEATILIT